MSRIGAGYPFVFCHVFVGHGHPMRPVLNEVLLRILVFHYNCLLRRGFSNIRARKQLHRYIILLPQSMASGRPHLTHPELNLNGKTSGFKYIFYTTSMACWGWPPSTYFKACHRTITPSKIPGRHHSFPGVNQDLAVMTLEGWNLWPEVAVTQLSAKTNRLLGWLRAVPNTFYWPCVFGRLGWENCVGVGWSSPHYVYFAAEHLMTYGRQTGKFQA